MGVKSEEAFYMFLSACGILMNWLLLMNLVTSNSDLFVDKTYLEGDFLVAFGCTITSLLLHLQWLISGVLLYKGNQKKNKPMITYWLAQNYVLTFLDIISGFYFFGKYLVNISNISTKGVNYDRGRSTTYFHLFLIFSRGCFVGTILCVILALFVIGRVKTIVRENRRIGMDFISQSVFQHLSNNSENVPVPVANLVTSSQYSQLDARSLEAAGQRQEISRGSLPPPYIDDNDQQSLLAATSTNT